MIDRTLGGRDVETNIVHLPIGLGAMKKATWWDDHEVCPGWFDRQIDGRASLQREELIPAGIVMKGSHPDRPGTFEPVMEVW